VKQEKKATKMKKLIVTLILLTASVANADQALTQNERTVALTILGEARGEGKRGMFAVASVIRQRSLERKITPAKVCLQSWQFSVWNAGKGKVKKESELYYLWKSKSAPYARKLAKWMCGKPNPDNLDHWPDITGKANHYCTLNCNPYWAKGKKPTKIIGNHKFYKIN
jgi:spore germination cell wall hydrolase CwlJ-like protein